MNDNGACKLELPVDLIDFYKKEKRAFVRGG